MIQVKRRVVRETAFVDYQTRRPFIVALEVGGRLLKIKVKGRRRWYAIPFEAIWREAMRIEAQRLKADKLAAREARRKERKGERS